jgi:hypothetical protein
MDITLSMPYDLKPDQWAVVDAVIRGMPGWKEYDASDNTPRWTVPFSGAGNITASVEPSGLVVYAEGDVPQDWWLGWLTMFCARLSLGLQMEVRDAEM